VNNCCNVFKILIKTIMIMQMYFVLITFTRHNLLLQKAMWNDVDKVYISKFQGKNWGKGYTFDI
jgi:hypothetical protein